jgi:hypothetical protein
MNVVIPYIMIAVGVIASGAVAGSDMRASKVKFVTLGVGVVLFVLGVYLYFGHNQQG